MLIGRTQLMLFVRVSTWLGPFWCTCLLHLPSSRLFPCSGRASNGENWFRDLGAKRKRRLTRCCFGAWCSPFFGGLWVKKGRGWTGCVNGWDEHWTIRFEWVVPCMDVGIKIRLWTVMVKRASKFHMHWCWSKHQRGAPIDRRWSFTFGPLVCANRQLGHVFVSIETDIHKIAIQLQAEENFESLWSMLFATLQLDWHIYLHGGVLEKRSI